MDDTLDPASADDGASGDGDGDGDGAGESTDGQTAADPAKPVKKKRKPAAAVAETFVMPHWLE